MKEIIFHALLILLKSLVFLLTFKTIINSGFKNFELFPFEFSFQFLLIYFYLILYIFNKTITILKFLKINVYSFRFPKFKVQIKSRCELHSYKKRLRIIINSLFRLFEKSQNLLQKIFIFYHIFLLLLLNRFCRFLCRFNFNIFRILQFLLLNIINQCLLFELIDLLLIQLTNRLHNYTDQNIVISLYIFGFVLLRTRDFEY